MPETPDPTQMLATILATSKLIEAEALFRFNTAPTKETTDKIIKAMMGASEAMRPDRFVHTPCFGVHIMSMCLPNPVFQGWLEPLLRAMQSGQAIGPDGNPLPPLPPLPR